MKQQVLVTRNIGESVVGQLSEHYAVDVWPHLDKAMPRDELLSRVAGKVGILCMLTDRIDKELLEVAGNQLRTVSTMSVGYDHVDVEALRVRNMSLGYTPDVLNDSVADLTIALMLNASRRIPEAAAAVKSGEWGTWSPYWMAGHDLAGATVGLVGMGKIAAVVAKRLQGFDCRVLYHSRTPKPQYEQELGIEKTDLDELLQSSDFVSLHAPLTEQTKGMFNRNLFNKMKPTSVFVNTSRGGLVNQEDLHEALVSGRLYAAGLDVTTPEPLPVDSPLLSLDNLVVLPHIGSASVRTRNRMRDIAVQNLLAGLGQGEFVSRLEIN